MVNGPCNAYDLGLRICKEYANVVYKDEAKFGIWGHDIGDLVIEAVTVDFDKKTVRVSVGS